MLQNRQQTRNRTLADRRPFRQKSVLPSRSDCPTLAYLSPCLRLEVFWSLQVPLGYPHAGHICQEVWVRIWTTDNFVSSRAQIEICFLLPIPLKHHIKSPARAYQPSTYPSSCLRIDGLSKNIFVARAPGAICVISTSVCFSLRWRAQQWRLFRNNSEHTLHFSVLSECWLLSFSISTC